MNFDDENLKNLVDFYKEELIRVIEGEQVTSIFTKLQRNNLRKAGILTYYNKTWGISEKIKEYIRI